MIGTGVGALLVGAILVVLGLGIPRTKTTTTCVVGNTSNGILSVGTIVDEIGLMMLLVEPHVIMLG